jgi:hypothetical protein
MAERFALFVLSVPFLIAVGIAAIVGVIFY